MTWQEMFGNGAGIGMGKTGMSMEQLTREVHLQGPIGCGEAGAGLKKQIKRERLIGMAMVLLLSPQTT